jgi:hypothetical protein
MRTRRSRQGFISVAFVLLATIVAGCATGGLRPGESVQADAGISPAAAAREEQLVQLCRNFCGGGRDGAVAPRGRRIRPPGSRTIRPP